MHIGYQDSGSAFSIIPKILNKITNKDYGIFKYRVIPIVDYGHLLKVW